MLKYLWVLMGGYLLAGSRPALAETSHPKRPDSLQTATELPLRKDIRDVFHDIFPRMPTASRDTLELQDGHHFVAILPALGYTLQTRGLAQVAVSIAYHEPQANMSTMLAALSFTQNQQVILTATSSVWRESNKLNWVGDWRIMHYPQSTYGLGMHTSTDRAVYMDYEYLRVYQSVLRKIRNNLYGGLGYQLDYHWNIESRTTRREIYRISHYNHGVRGETISSGVAVNVLYNSRENAINPQGGTYLNVLYRPNMRALGSDVNFQTLLVDARRYLHLRPGSDNVLALWSYSALTLRGDPPFLDLPSTGWDTYGNLGRGFIQGRFRGKNLLYSEAEYRFGITHNRLLGGVLFANAQSVSEVDTRRFDKVVPAAGLGVRLNLNKASHTNLAVDYGFGGDGSRALSFNVGEVF